MCFEFTLLIFIEVWVLSWEHHECTLLKFEMFPTFCLRKLDIVTLWVVGNCGLSWFALPFPIFILVEFLALLPPLLVTAYKCKHIIPIKEKEKEMEMNCVFKVIWATKFTGVELIVGEDGKVEHVKSKVCINIKDLMPKLDSLETCHWSNVGNKLEKTRFTN